MRQVAVIGTGSYVPENVVTNHDLSVIVDTSDDWIYSRTGIKERRISSGEGTASMAVKAAKRALEKASLDPIELDLIICATITPDYYMPSMACMIQDALGSSNAVAFDLVAACSGLVYGMITAEQYIRSGMYRKALIIGAETLSKIVNWEDRSTCVLFGDGAGAVILSETEDSNRIIARHLMSDGSKYSILTCLGMPLSNPFVTSMDKGMGSTITMDGQEVFKYAIRTIVDHINQLLLQSHLTLDDIACIIPHQANKRIIEQAARLCHTSLDKFYMNLEFYGNTSAASIGIALDEACEKGVLLPGDRCILVGFGGGMTSGSLLIEI